MKLTYFLEEVLIHLTALIIAHLVHLLFSNILKWIARFLNIKIPYDLPTTELPVSPGVPQDSKFIKSCYSVDF